MSGNAEELDDIHIYSTAIAIPVKRAMASAGDELRMPIL
jgi:hypothetical protein